MRLRDFPKVAELAQMYVEADGMTYKEAIQKAKEKLSSERVGAQINSDNNISKEFNDSITEKSINEN